MNARDALQNIDYHLSGVCDESIATLTALVDDHEAMLKRAEQVTKMIDEQIMKCEEDGIDGVLELKELTNAINYILKGERK